MKKETTADFEKARDDARNRALVDLKAFHSSPLAKQSVVVGFNKGVDWTLEYLSKQALKAGAK